MDLQRLREETRPEHEATEAAMQLTAPGLDLPVYTAVLQLLFPLLRSWEEWARQSAPAGVQPLLAARQRSHLLEADLRVLGVAHEGLKNLMQAQIAPVDWAAVVVPGAPQLSPAAFEASFLGAFYVLEGSTLGGRFLARHVEAALGLEPGRGDAYFQGHGEATGALWRETTAAIAAVPEEQSPWVIAAARRTFRAFGAVLAAEAKPVERSGALSG